MNGPEHYQEAERLIEAARKDFREAGEGYARTLAESRAHVALAAAQVHATLALTAATAQEYADRWTGNHEHRSWSEAI